MVVIEDLAAILIIGTLHAVIVSGSFQITHLLVTIGKIGFCWKNSRHWNHYHAVDISLVTTNNRY